MCIRDRGRVSFCYDRAALDARKEHKPKNCVLDAAAAMGVEVLTEEEYFALQKLGEFDTVSYTHLVYGGVDFVNQTSLRRQKCRLPATFCH